MWFVTKTFNRLLKFIAPLFYLGTKRINGFAVICYGKDTVFIVRPNSLDAVMLYEIWKCNSYREALIRRNDVVVDIGANIGGYAVRAAKCGAKVIAYEPSPGTYDLLV
ncbi:MAG: hypothetical protein AABX69_01920 [Nanoarchaeota archaeon]